MIDVPHAIGRAAMDPTGIRRASRGVDETAQEVVERLRQLDMDALNTAICEITLSVAAVRERLESLPPNWAERILTEIESARLRDISDGIQREVAAARFNDISERIQSAVARIEQQTEAVRIDDVNRAVGDIRQAIRTIEMRFAEIDVGAINRLLHESGDGVAESRLTVDESRLPLRTFLWLANALVAVLLAVALIWLIRLLRCVKSA